MKPAWIVAMAVSSLLGLAVHAAAAPSPWDQPAAALAEEIAAILGPGQARLTIRNLSTVSTDAIPAIRSLLEQDLKTRGILASGAESANTIRVTLSENPRERLWVAEIVEGSETHVAMVHVEPGNVRQAQTASGLTLRKQTVLILSEPVLVTLEMPNWMIVVEPEEIVIYSHAAGGWQEQKRVGIGQKQPLARDPRGVIVASQGGEGFEVSLAGIACSGAYVQAQSAGEWSVHCHESDDPWPLLASPTEGAAPIKAFYTATLDYFTGIVSPSIGVDLPPFYTAALLPRPDGSGLLINGMDGKVQIAESGALKPITGTRDWGSDFASLRSGCGIGTQIVVSGSGEAGADSLRSYELPAQEAVPVSAPLAMDGTVMSLWTAQDGKSIFAVVRSSSDQYEVDRVTALCN
jgi:hypothetical protein